MHYSCLIVLISLLSQLFSNYSFWLFHFHILNIIEILTEHSQANPPWKTLFTDTRLLLIYSLLVIFTENLQGTFTYGEYYPYSSIAILVNILLFLKSWTWGKIYFFAVLILVLDIHIQERVVAMRIGNIQGEESQVPLPR